MSDDFVRPIVLPEGAEGIEGGDAPSQASVKPDVEAQEKFHQVMEEARERWKTVSNWEADWRPKYKNDLLFAEGDSENHNQWPRDVESERNENNRPCLTINLIRQHNLQIINECKKNKSVVKISATGGEATKASADVMSAIIRRIEYESDAADVYQTAAEFQVKGGIGWIRLATEYAAPDSMDQIVRIRKVPDSLAVYVDPECKDDCCLDARYAFVYDDVPEADFAALYPEYKHLRSAPLGDDAVDAEDLGGRVRVAEYFRKVEEDDEVVSFLDPTDGLRKTLLRSKMPAALLRSLLAASTTTTRKTAVPKIEWYLLIGGKVADTAMWPGPYIPLVAMKGEEVVLEGRMDRRGHTRWLLDAQRMYNYNASAQVEHVALQTNVPWVAPVKAIEENMEAWASSNNRNHAVLPYNDWDDDLGRAIAPPIKTPPPTAAPAYTEGMNVAFNQIMMASGQWQNQMGMLGNERTGAAIKARQAQSDTSVFHFQDNYGKAIRAVAKQLLALIPVVYDTRRVARLLGPDDAEFEAVIDPGAAEPLQEAREGEAIKRIFNPKLGKYDVMATVGPDYGTRRNETAEALTLILTQAPAMTPYIGDLLMRALDFNEAGEAAARLRRMVPKQALGEGPSQVEMQQGMQIQQLQTALSKTLERFASVQMEKRSKDEMRDIDVYKAQTDRMRALADLLPEDRVEAARLLAALGKETLGETLKPIIEENLMAAGDEGAGGAPEPEPSKEMPNG